MYFFYLLLRSYRERDNSVWQSGVHRVMTDVPLHALCGCGASG